MSFFLLLNMKEDILKSIANYFHSIFVHTMEVNGYKQLFEYQHFYILVALTTMYFHKKRVRCTYCVHIVMQITSATTEVGYGSG